VSECVCAALLPIPVRSPFRVLLRCRAE
jgi:hypothetical protein